MLMPGTKSVRNSNCVVKQVFRIHIWGLVGENPENWRSSQRIWIKVWEGLKHPGDGTWEGSLSVFPATEADDSATPAGQVEGTVTILPGTSVELKSLFNSFLPR